MKLLTHLIFSALVLSSPCYSTEALTSESPPIGRSKRLLPDESHKKRPRQEINWDDKVITLDKMKERLEYKAVVLTAELPKARETLKAIRAHLEEKARSLKDTNFKRATELIAAASGINFMDNSANTILGNLEARDYSQENLLVNISMAIIASGALKSQFEQVIKFLSESNDTKDINYGVLTEVCASIHKITKDIANPVLSY